MLKNPFKKFPDPDQEADDFLNLISSSLSKHTHLVKFSRRHDQQFLREVANRRTNGQTPGKTQLSWQK